jgi:hypothetical protein
MVPWRISSGRTLILHNSIEPDSVSEVVDEMVTDGIACGVDGVVVVGELPIDQERWDSIQTELVADGHPAIDETGWVSVPKPDEDPTLSSGFAWRDGVLYYALNPFIFLLLPAFAA